jgi:uncharacterized protein (DUF885 family)
MPRSTILLTGAVILHVVVARGGAQSSPPAAARADSLGTQVTRLADRYVSVLLAEFPETATWEGLSDYDHDRLNDNSLAGLRRWQRFEDGLLAQVEKVDADPLVGRPEWVTYGFLREALEASVRTRVCHQELWPVSQMGGWQVTYASLIRLQPVGTPRARKQALARWRQLPRFLQVETDNLRRGLREGYSSPRHNVELVLAQLDSLLAIPTEQSPFFAPAARDSTPAFRREWSRLLEQEFRIAFRRYRQYLAADYLPRAREPIGVSANPNGNACYAASLRSLTSLDWSGADVFAAGQAAVAEGERLAAALGQQVYGTTRLDSLRDYQRRLAPWPRDEVLAYTRRLLGRARDSLPRWIGRLPASDVTVEPMRSYEEATGYSHYEQASDDLSRPGTYFINLNPENQPRVEADATAFHETWPGHHLQIALARERPEAHRITRLVGNGAFIEGWGRYAERLADEMHLYSSDTTRLELYLGLPTGMVADPGIHAMGWTRDSAVTYAMTKQGWSRQAAEAYVDRIAVWPGQMTTYGLGELEIRRLRAEAERRLGSRFDIRAFHDAVLGNGSVTLLMLRQQIQRWLDRSDSVSAPHP